MGMYTYVYGQNLFPNLKKQGIMSSSNSPPTCILDSTIDINIYQSLKLMKYG